MRTGDTGAEVSALQQRLSALGFALADDAVFGARTDEAVRTFQLVCGLTVDGVVLGDTATAIVGDAWSRVHSSEVFQAVERLQRTETLTATSTVTTFEVDLSWPVPLPDRPTDLPVRSGTWRGVIPAQVRWVVDLLSPDPGDLGDPTQPHSVLGQIGSTLLSPSLLGAEGVLGHQHSGAAHPNPVGFASVVDLDAGRLLGPADLFMPGSNWPDRLRSLARDALPGGPDLPAEPATFHRMTVAPSGIRVWFTPEQLGLPLASGLTAFDVQWQRIESEIRPSVPARCVGQAAGGVDPIPT